jgi:hypothetical protein
MRPPDRSRLVKIAARGTIENLAAWLNSEDPKRAKDRRQVIEAIQLLQKLDDLQLDVQKGFDLASKSGVRFGELQTAVLSIYSQTPLYWGLVWNPLSKHWHVDRLVATRKIAINWALVALSDAGRSGSLDRLRQCQRCSRYFVAKRKTKRYCSEKCQQDAWLDYYKTPAGKKKLAKQVARWRAARREALLAAERYRIEHGNEDDRRLETPNG